VPTRHVVTVIADRASLAEIGDVEALGRVVERAGGRAEDLVTVEVLGTTGYQLMPPVPRPAFVAMPAVIDPGPASEGDLARVAADLHLTSATLATDGFTTAFLVIWLAADQHTRLAEFASGLALMRPVEVGTGIPPAQSPRPAVDLHLVLDRVLVLFAALGTAVAALVYHRFGTSARLRQLQHEASPLLDWRHPNGASWHGAWTPHAWLLLGLTLAVAVSVFLVAVQLVRLRSPRLAVLVALICADTALVLALGTESPLTRWQLG
jgi:hypothetical protein